MNKKRPGRAQFKKLQLTCPQTLLPEASLVPTSVITTNRLAPSLNLEKCSCDPLKGSYVGRTVRCLLVL